MLRLNNCATISSRIEISVIRATAKQFHQMTLSLVAGRSLYAKA